jgi:hypothetical protein
MIPFMAIKINNLWLNSKFKCKYIKRRGGLNFKPVRGVPALCLPVEKGFLRKFVNLPICQHHKK